MVCLHVYTYTKCMSSACGVQKVSEPLELELQMAGRYYVGTGNQI